MRILFLADTSSVHSHRWINFFVDRGHDIEWVSLYPDASKLSPAVRFHAVSSPGLQLLQVLHAVALVRRVVRERPVDLVHAHYAGAYGLIGALAGIHPLVLTAWGSDVLKAGRSPVTGPLVRFAVRVPDLITCDAEHLRRAVLAMGVPEERVRIVFFGTDTERCHPRRARRAVRERLGVGDAPLVISVRSLHRHYDVATFIRAVPAVLQEVPAARFVVAGAGPEREALERLAQELGVSAVVQFVGVLDADTLPEYVATADVYVSTSPSDGGLAASTAEAMACGTAVVVSDFGENRDWVEDGVSGRVVPIGAADQFARAVVDLLQQPALRATMAAAGRQVIETRNNYNREMAKMERLYVELIVSSRSDGASAPARSLGNR